MIANFPHGRGERAFMEHGGGSSVVVRRDRSAVLPEQPMWLYRPLAAPGNALPTMLLHINGTALG